MSSLDPSNPDLVNDRFGGPFVLFDSNKILFSLYLFRFIFPNHCITNQLNKQTISIIVGAYSFQGSKAGISSVISSWLQN